MELQITLRASRAAWFFLVLALVVWSVWEAFHGGDTTLPAFLLGPRYDFLPGAVDRPGQSGDDRVKRELYCGLFSLWPWWHFHCCWCWADEEQGQELRKARGLRQEDVAALLG